MAEALDSRGLWRGEDKGKNSSIRTKTGLKLAGWRTWGLFFALRTEGRGLCRVRSGMTKCPHWREGAERRAGRRIPKSHPGGNFCGQAAARGLTWPGCPFWAASSIAPFMNPRLGHRFPARGVRVVPSGFGLRRARGAIRAADAPLGRKRDGALFIFVRTRRAMRPDALPVFCRSPASRYQYVSAS